MHEIEYGAAVRPVTDATRFFEYGAAVRIRFTDILRQ